ncbi:uncharacterized protein LOC132295764 [Cornus florida]|uniref:uncharacterized protein LOC132295764 n=1 Tax=Cornus florida TaxID=4283 RepID=UPI00289F127B|nr:uncharacterized protein LOC132295764 [Cornus florida]
MEKNHEFFSTAKLNFFILLFIMMVHDLSHGSRIDQAGPLRALRRAKMKAQGGTYPSDDEKLSPSSNSGGQQSSSDVGKMEDDLIKGGLPGQPSGVLFNQYAGYITVDKSNGRSLFYYFAEAAENPSSTPLILWLNGGPGCSSLGVGAMVENGPFGVKPDGKTLYLRQHSWNKVANVLFLESPAGVGFSYSNTSSDYATAGDKRTGEDTYIFLTSWFKRFPQYKARDLYIMGESYSGYYIPELSELIINTNMEVDSSLKIQLKGIMIGNGIMDDETDGRGMYDYIWSHALISDETHRGLKEHCNNFTGPNCEEFVDKIGKEIGKIDFYNIYSPLCLSSPDSLPTKPIRFRGYDPCEENYAYLYLNLPHVQQALHANTTKLPYAWDYCSKVLTSWKDSPSTVIPIYRRLISSGLRILLYSGDMDAVVPVTGTRYSIDLLNLKVIKPWHPWSDGTREVAGYQVVYDGLTFATVRGAGHEVPRFQPRRTLALLKMFYKKKGLMYLIKQHFYNAASMKVAFLISLLLSLVAFIQCYAGIGFDPLEKILEAQRSRKFSASYVTKAMETEYSPVYVGRQGGLKEVDKITTLPGQPNGVNLVQYSGYVTVDPKAGRALFYYFVESKNSSSKPLVLWLNGGPGCSSFGNGAMMELGPFRVNSDGKTLSENKYAWNNAANILFLESPAGVGFSYSNTTSDSGTNGDKKTAVDSYTFLVNWLERFPEYKTRDFFISGESYAGHFVPQLAQLILQNNKITKRTVINLKGIAIGNAYIDYETSYTGMYDYFWSHAIISDETHEGIVLNCNFSSETDSDACATYIDQARRARENIFFYDIYAPFCSSSSNAPSLSAFDPCSDTYVHSYLNTHEVQRSLHANVTGLPGTWESCSLDVAITWIDKPLTVLPTIQELMGSGISVWIYSGDTDGRVPVTTSRYAIKKLKTSVETPWYPWYTQGEVGGYAVGYKNLTFVTIRGAGHFVPSYQPARALAFFSSFLDGKLPPSNQN